MKLRDQILLHLLPIKKINLAKSSEQNDKQIQSTRNRVQKCRKTLTPEQKKKSNLPQQTADSQVIALNLKRRLSDNLTTPDSHSP